MSHGVKNFHWRDGRPRWIVSANLRAKGFKGKDLKDESGQWLPLVQAKMAAQKLNDEADVPRARVSERGQRDAASREVGYVYFLFTDTDKVKIGFSKKPGFRVQVLAEAMENHLRSAIVVAGTRKNEQELHDRFFKERFKTEWFHASRRILNVALNAAIVGGFSDDASHEILAPP